MSWSLVTPGGGFDSTWPLKETRTSAAARAIAVVRRFLARSSPRGDEDEGREQTTFSQNDLVKKPAPRGVDESQHGSPPQPSDHRFL